MLKTEVKRVLRQLAGKIQTSIEIIGEKLRGMMPWIGANRLVDKAKN